MLVMPRISHESSLEESDVEDWRVEVDELEEEHFERQIVIKIGLGAMHF